LNLFIPKLATVRTRATLQRDCPASGRELIRERKTPTRDGEPRSRGIVGLPCCVTSSMFHKQNGSDGAAG